MKLLLFFRVNSFSINRPINVVTKLNPADVNFSEAKGHIGPKSNGVRKVKSKLLDHK